MTPSQLGKLLVAVGTSTLLFRYLWYRNRFLATAIAGLAFLLVIYIFGLWSLLMSSFRGYFFLKWDLWLLD